MKEQDAKLVSLIEEVVLFPTANSKKLKTLNNKQTKSIKNDPEAPTGQGDHPLEDLVRAHLRKYHKLNAIADLMGHANVPVTHAESARKTAVKHHTTAEHYYRNEGDQTKGPRDDLTFKAWRDQEKVHALSELGKVLGQKIDETE